MKIVLLDVKKNNKDCINRDLAGGFGSYTDMGDAFVPRMIGVFKRRGIRLPNTTLGYLAAIFEKKGHHVEYRRNVNFNADLVIVASSIVGFIEEIEAIAEIKKKGSIKVGVFGPFCSVKPELYLNTCDFVILGEPEDVAMKIADGYIPDGIIESKPIENLDSLPFPKWDVFPIKGYSYSPVLKERPFITIQTSRGCPYSCYYYCPYIVVQGRRFRSRSVDSVIKELKYLYSSLNIRSILFRDPVFTLNKERSLRIAEEMIRNNMDFHWACETHLSTLNEGLIDLFYRAGLRAINTGIENCDEEILKKSHRYATQISYQERIIQYCERKGIGISAFYILGTLHDTEDSTKNVIRYAKKLNTSFAQFAISTPYPGTPYYEDIKEKIRSSNWGDFTGVFPVFEHPTISHKRMLQLRNQAYRLYYMSLRWGWGFLKRSLKNTFTRI